MLIRIQKNFIQLKNEYITVTKRINFQRKGHVSNNYINAPKNLNLILLSY